MNIGYEKGKWPVLNKLQACKLTFSIQQKGASLCAILMFIINLCLLVNLPDIFRQ
jgi:hypothetical protein